MMVVSQKRVPFDPTEVVMDGAPVEQVAELKLVGFIFDSKLRLKAMVQNLVKKGRVRVAALRRLTNVLDSENMKTMYLMFVRSVMEYGNVVYRGASKTHLSKLDRVQDTAARLGKFEVETLLSRRHAAAASMCFKLLDGGGRGCLDEFKPKLLDRLQLTRKQTRSDCDSSLQLERAVKSSSMDAYKNSYLGQIKNIWSKIPHQLIDEGSMRGWFKVKKRVVKFFRGKWEPGGEPCNKKIKPKPHNTSLNQELNKQTDWILIARELKERGIQFPK